MVQFIFTNVRVVPPFKYTLISVDQLWEEQRVDSRFADLHHLQFPKASGGLRIPYDPKVRLNSIALVSVTRLKGAKSVKAVILRPDMSVASGNVAATTDTPASGPPAPSPPVPAAAPLPTAEPDISMAPALAEAPLNTPTVGPTAGAPLGFHSPKSTAHISHLSAARAGELMHRRSHAGHRKIQAMPHYTRKAPTNLTSFSGCTCADCACANIKKSSHSGTLRAPAERCGKLHVDLLQMDASIHGYKYAAFFIDEYSRYVFVRFMKQKSEIVDMTKLVIAEFCATVGVPMTPDQITLEKPRVFSIHSDHEGGYLSHYFADFRADTLLHHTMSPPHDHDLNPIAEKVIGDLSALSRTFKLSSNCPSGFWPYMIVNAVNWHNETNGSTGSSSASEQLSPHQNFTLKQPNGMDLPAFGCRAVAIKPSPHKVKTDLSPRGWMCILLGRSQTSIGAYNLWCPALGKVICSSHILCDEENFPWFGTKAHRLLTATSKALVPALPQTLDTHQTPPSDDAITKGDTVADLNLPPTRKELHALSVFSGEYYRSGGLPKHLIDLGWDSVTQIDNSPKGGGWSHDLLNDETYARLKAEVAAGKYDLLFIAFPCTTFSMSRFFQDPDNPGPPVIHCKDYPDGRPLDQIPATHHKELRDCTKLLDRTCTLATLARNSPRKTTLVWESPAKRSDKGTTHHCNDMPLHSIVFDTTQFKDLVSDTQAISPWSYCTFAWCRLGGEGQKYTTLAYTNDAARVFDQLNLPEFQCNHTSHPKRAGGRLPDGSWASEDFVAFPELLNARIALGATVARTGTAKLGRRPEVKQPAAPLEPSPAPGKFEASVPSPDQGPLPESPAAATPASMAGESPLGYVPFVPPASPHLVAAPSSPGHARPTRAVRNTTQAARSDSQFQSDLATQRLRAAQREENRAAKAFGASLPDIAEMATPEALRVDPDAMEAQVASLVSKVHHKSGGGRSPVQPLGEWLDVPPSRVGHHDSELPNKLRNLPQGSYVIELAPNEVKVLFGDSLATDPTHTPYAHVSLLSSLQAVDDTPLNHKDAVRMGGKWTTAELKEINNHIKNGSWEQIKASEVPTGRNTHKLVWVFKVKRDGTCKARLCVQGCTMVAGIDYDQVFSSTLRTSSVRTLCAYAAKYCCCIRSVDWVAAYLQGELLEGEVVYCHMPQGYEKYDASGRPYKLKICKPIYGIPQAGRRFQRSIFPWLRGKCMRQLDEADSSVWVYDPDHKPTNPELSASEGPNAPVLTSVRDAPDTTSPDVLEALATYHSSREGKERLVCGVYVDNLQLIHSASPGDPSSKIHSFLNDLQTDWDVEDEGEMVDLLGIQIRRHDDGSITLHQEKYVNQLVKEFLPEGVPKGVPKNCLPYSKRIHKIVGEATLSPLTVGVLTLSSLRPINAASAP